MLRDAARRFGLLLGGTAGGTAVFALLIGLALGAGVSRSISIGFYLVGSFLLILGFFAGNRGPARQPQPAASRPAPEQPFGEEQAFKEDDIPF